MATGTNAARGFLQVGEWSYPLIPAQSPVLHSFYGAYMFPDATNTVPGKGQISLMVMCRMFPAALLNCGKCQTYALESSGR